MYPGWRVRIYHNVTRGNEEVRVFIDRTQTFWRCGGNSVNISAPRTFLICAMSILYRGWTNGTPRNHMECFGGCRYLLIMKMFPLFQPQPWNNPSPATWGPNCPEVSVKGSWWLPNSKYCHYNQHAHWRMPFQERVREAVGEWERSDKQFHVRQKMGSDHWIAMSLSMSVMVL